MEKMRLSIEESRQVYEKHLCVDFPADEVKPFSTIQRGMESGAYTVYGFYEAGALMGYSFLFRQGHWILLDYFAVCAGKRGSGIGGRIFAQLRQALRPGEVLLIEAEKPREDLVDPQDLRRRRIAFYERNGARQSGMLGWAFGVCYRFLYCGEPQTDSQVEEGMRAVYGALLTPASYRANIRFARG